MEGAFTLALAVAGLLSVSVVMVDFSVSIANWVFPGVVGL